MSSVVTKCLISVKNCKSIEVVRSICDELGCGMLLSSGILEMLKAKQESVGIQIESSPISQTDDKS